MTPAKAASCQILNAGNPIGSDLFAEERAHILATLEAQYEEYARQSSPDVAVGLMTWRALASRRFGVGKDALDWFAPLANPYFRPGIHDPGGKCQT